MFPNCLEPGLVNYGFSSFKSVQIKAMKRANSKTLNWPRQYWYKQLKN